MTYQIITKYQTPVVIPVTPDNGQNLQGLASDNNGGFWIGGMSLNINNKPGIVYHHSKEGVNTSFSLPYPPNHPAKADAPSPSASEIILHKDIVYVSDYNYGTIYKYDTKTSANAAAILVDIPTDGSLKSQSAGMCILDDKTLWFLEIHGCWLYSCDLTTGVISNKIDLAKVVGTSRVSNDTPPMTPAQTLITTQASGKHYLWLVMSSNLDASQSWLIRINSGTPGETKTWLIDGASSLAVFRNTLYISANKAVMAKSTVDDTPPAKIVTTDASSMNNMIADAAGYLWVSEYKSGGKVYEIDPGTGVVSAYRLATPISGQPPIPAQLFWMPPEAGTDQDKLFVTDSSSNAQAIQISPPEAIDKNGSSLLIVSADPSSKTISENDIFTPRVWVKVKSNAVPRESLVQFSILQDPANIITSTLPAELHMNYVMVPSTGQQVKLQASSVDGTVQLKARLRGQTDFKPIFNGTVEAPVLGLSFSSMPVQKARATENFPNESTKLEVNITPKSARKLVKITLSNATFVTGDNTGSITLPTNTEGKVFVPLIKAGKTAGEMKITAESGGKKISISWYIVPKPTKIDVDDSPTYKKIFIEDFNNLLWTVKGHTIDEDTSSPEIPVPEITMLLKFEGEKGVAHFTSGSSDKKLDHIEMVSDSKGQASLRKSDHSIHLDDQNAKNINFVIHAVHEINKDNILVTKSVVVKLI